MKRTGMAGKIRKALCSLGMGGRSVESSALAIELDMVADKEKQTLYRVLRDFVKSGEITRIGRGVYIYNGNKKKPQLQEIMWRYLRAKRTVTIDGLAEISGASREYAAEWVYMLVRREIVEKIRLGGYRLISDPVIMPVNDDNRKKLHKLRKQKKREALVALGEAEDAINKAREALEGMNIEHRTSNIEHWHV
jgi:hypothetical protein